MRDRLTPEDIDRILSGSAEGDARIGSLGSLGSFARRVRGAWGAAEPSLEVRDRHLRAMVQAVGTGPSRVRGPILARPSRVRTAVATTCFVAAGAALAAAGSLGPAQHFVADTVGQVGLDLPGRSGEPAAGGHDAPQGEAGKVRAAENRQDALEFTDAKKEWTACVAEKAEANGDDDDGFDPEADPPEGCGPKPGPLQFRDDVTANAPRTANPAGKIPGAEDVGEDDDEDGPLTGQGAEGQQNGEGKRGRGRQGGDDDG